MYLSFTLWGGGTLANGIPHFINGISGNRFQSPFASPPTIGESSPTVNVLWGIFNLVAGALLVFGIGDFTPGINADTGVTVLGAVLASILLSLHFGKVRNGR